MGLLDNYFDSLPSNTRSLLNSSISKVEPYKPYGQPSQNAPVSSPVNAPVDWTSVISGLLPGTINNGDRLSGMLKLLSDFPIQNLSAQYNNNAYTGYQNSGGKSSPIDWLNTQKNPISNFRYEP